MGFERSRPNPVLVFVFDLSLDRDLNVELGSPYLVKIDR